MSTPSNQPERDIDPEMPDGDPNVPTFADLMTDHHLVCSLVGALVTSHCHLAAEEYFTLTQNEIDVLVGSRIQIRWRNLDGVQCLDIKVTPPTRPLVQ